MKDVPTWFKERKGLRGTSGKNRGGEEPMRTGSGDKIKAPRIFF